MNDKNYYINKLMNDKQNGISKMMEHKETEKTKYKTTRLKQVSWHPKIEITGRENFLNEEKKIIKEIIEENFSYLEDMLEMPVSAQKSKPQEIYKIHPHKTSKHQK